MYDDGGLFTNIVSVYCQIQIIFFNFPYYASTIDLGQLRYTRLQYLGVGGNACNWRGDLLGIVDKIHVRDCIHVAGAVYLSFGLLSFFQLVQLSELLTVVKQCISILAHW